MRQLSNPLGRRLPLVQLVHMGVGERVHVKHPSPSEAGTLCAPRDTEKKRWTANLRPADGQVVDCYRCLKLMAVNTHLRGSPLDVGEGQGSTATQAVLAQAYEKNKATKK